MSTELGAADLKISIEGEANSSVIILNEFRERSEDGQELTDSSKTATVNIDLTCTRKICLIAKLQCVFFPMKLCGLYFEDVRNPDQEDSLSRRICAFGKRLYQCIVLLALWLNFGKTLAMFWIDDDTITDNSQLITGLLWFLQTALQASICFFTMRITSKKSSLKSLMLYWNSQPNFDELVAETYMIKCVKRTMIAIYFFVALNLVFYALILFYPSESLQNLAQALISPLPINNTAVKAVGFVVCGVYCTGAWLMPFAIFTAVCLTLIHQCSRLRKTMRLTASADGLARVKILRRQHSSLCGSVRKVDNLFKFLTLVVYVTNIPLVCFLLYHLIFVKYNDAVTLVILSYWFVYVVFIMVGVSFLGANLNNKVSIEG